ncbi:MAG: substrate-binding periplasmic protein [Spirochaeta sp.]
MHIKNVVSGILFLLISTALWADPPLRMAIFRLEPFLTEAGESKNPGGITVEYWRQYIAPRMGVDIEVVGPYPIRRVEEMLEHGLVDVASQFTRIPDREHRFIFSETPLTEIDTGIVVLRESPLTSVESAEDLFGMQMVFIEGAYIPPMLLHEQIDIHLVHNEDFRRLQLNMLLAGRVDAMLDINLVSLRQYIQKNGYADRIRIIPLPSPSVEVYSMFRDTPRGRELQQRFDAANQIGREEGIFRRLTSEYLQRMEDGTQ